MAKKYLIINTGSTSKKFSLFQGGQELFRAHLESEGDGMISTIFVGEKTEKEDITKEQFDKSLDYVLENLISKNIISDKKDVYAIGIRVVAPGIFFQANKLVDDDYIKNLKVAEEKVPLHIKPVLKKIEYIKKVFPNIPTIGISDSNFHKDLPDVARLYSIPKKDADNLGIYRYGYHGISFKSLVEKMEKKFGGIPSKTIMCHLGGGISITALKDGKSIDTTMGFTPLEGVVMATRVGDIDPGAVLYLSQKMGMSVMDLERYFNYDCGLKGISEKSSDVRELIKLEKIGDRNAKNALDIFAYRIKKQIGGMMAVLGGVDLIVFSGTIGERSFIMRSRICSGLLDLGIILDEKKNESVESIDETISSKKSKVKVMVLKTEEMKQIAEETENYI